MGLLMLVFGPLADMTVLFCKFIEGRMDFDWLLALPCRSAYVASLCPCRVSRFSPFKRPISCHEKEEEISLTMNCHAVNNYGIYENYKLAFISEVKMEW